MFRNLNASRFNQISLRLVVTLALLLSTFAPNASVQAQENAVEAAIHAVVRVLPQQCVESICNDLGVGSGVIIDPAGIILTAWHVTTLVQSKDPSVTPHTYANDFVIETVDSVLAKPVARYRAKLIATREKSDLALLRIYATYDKQPLGASLNLPTLPISTEEPRTEHLRLMGFPPAGGASISYPQFEQSGFDIDDGGQLIKVQAQLSRGFSGGPTLIERNGHYEIVGVVIKARGEGAEVGLLRAIGGLKQLDWQPGAQQVWADNAQVGTYTTNGEATLYISANLHMLDYTGRSSQMIAFAFDNAKKPFIPTQSKLQRTQKGQLALPRNFTAQRSIDRIEPFTLSAPVKELGAPPEHLLFRIVLLDMESRKTLWDSGQFLPAQMLPNPPAPKSASPASTSTGQPDGATATTSAPPPTLDLAAMQAALATQVIATITAQAAALASPTPTTTPTPSPTDTPDPAVQKTAEAARVATAVAIALAALPTATPTATPTPNSGATATAEANVIATAIAATLAAQPSATPNAAATDAARANAMQTAIALTLTARPTPPPTATPTPPTKTLSADNLRIVYAYGDVGDSDLRLADVQSGAVRTIAGQACDEAEPSWSPDGVYIAYHANCAESYDIYRVDSDSGTTTRLTTTSDIDEREPDYSPDGGAIVYRVNPRKETKTNDVGELWVMDANGGNAYALGVIGRAPAWSPDGQRIAYMLNQAGLWNIYIYDLASQHSTQLTHCTTNCRWPAWSPDGQMLIYNTTTKPNNTVADALWVIPVDGGNPRRITSGTNAGRPSWSHAGLIAFSSDRGIEYMHEDGTGRTVLIPSDENWAPYWSK